MARLQYTIPDDLKKKAEMIFHAQGLTPKIAVKMFYVEVVKQKGLPFQPSMVEIPNDETLKAMEDTEKGIGLQGPFKTSKEFFKALKS